MALRLDHGTGELYQEDNGASPHDDPGHELPARPRTRGDCLNGPRPCPWVSCKFNLAIDVAPKGVSPDLLAVHEHGDVSMMAETCALDVAERGPMQYRELAKLLGVSHQRVVQIERSAIAKLEARLRRLGIDGIE